MYHGNSLDGNYNSLRGVYAPHEILLQPSLLEVMYNDVQINIHCLWYYAQWLLV